MSSKAEQEMRYKLVDAAINFSIKKATCKVKIPSDDLQRYGDSLSADPLAHLVVKDPEDIYCMQMMRECVHKNILHALVIAETETKVAVWAEPSTDSVSNYLQSTALGSHNSNAFNGPKVVLPTASLQSFISQVFEAFEYLWAQGKYHGNFKLQNTYYYQTSFGEKIVKLTCFKPKDRENVKHCQAEDCQDVGMALESVSQTATALNLKNHSFDCYIIDDLAGRLQKIAWMDVKFVKQDILGHPFFWNCNEMKTFFISEIPIALNDQNFRTNVEGCKELCSLPWNNSSYGAFLQVMVDYRAKKNMRAYNFRSRVNYVQFLSGLYAHENELQLSSSVDKAVRKMDPHAHMILYKLIPRARRPANPIR